MQTKTLPPAYSGEISPYAALVIVTRLHPDGITRFLRARRQSLEPQSTYNDITYGNQYNIDLCVRLQEPCEVPTKSARNKTG